MVEVKTDLKIDLNNLDKSNWKTYRFDEIAKNISERVDPNNTDLTVYVGLEHIDSESLHIKRHGTPDDVNGTKLKFYKGDIIFGRRRAYQRKAAIATWDGFCSAHALVLRAKPDVISPELFPFFLHSDLFMNRAIDISVGSLSPTINWGTLKHQEFLLPPIEQHQKLAEILWAQEDQINNKCILQNKVDVFLESLFKDAVYSSSDKLTEFGHWASKHPVVKLGEVIDKIQYGISESLDGIGLMPVLRMNNIQEGSLNTDDLKYYTPNGSELDNFLLKKGDVLFNRTNSFDLVGKTCLFEEDVQYTFASYLIRIVTKNNLLLPSYLNFYMNTAIGLAKIRKYRTPGVSQSNINAQSLRNLLIPLPKPEFQRELMNKISKVNFTKVNLIKNIIDSKSSQEVIMNRIL
ncbi:MAG: restriction endonuclease subunit S [Colwellia sp.]